MYELEDSLNHPSTHLYFSGLLTRKHFIFQIGDLESVSLERYAELSGQWPMFC